MSTRAGTVPLSDLQFIKIYFNRKRLRSHRPICGKC